MIEEPLDHSEDDDEEQQQAEALLSSIRESQPAREILLAEETRCLDIDRNDPAMIFPIGWPKSSLAHTSVRHRSPEGLVLAVIDTWVPAQLIRADRLAELDFYDLIPWLVEHGRLNARRVREQVFVMRSTATKDAEHLEVFPDELTLHRGRWLFDGNDSLLAVERHIARIEALLVYERDLMFETLYPPVFVPTGTLEVGQ